MPDGSGWKTIGLLVFSGTTIFNVYRELSEKSRKRQFCGWKSFLGKRVRINTLSNGGIWKSISECTTYRTLKQMDYNSRGLSQVPRLSAKKSEERPQLTKNRKKKEKWKIAETLPGPMNLHFCYGVRVVRMKFSTWKYGSILSCIICSSGCWGWNSMRNIFSTYIETFSINKISFECRCQHRYCG